MVRIAQVIIVAAEDRPPTKELEEALNQFQHKHGMAKILSANTSVTASAHNVHYVTTVIVEHTHDS